MRVTVEDYTPVTPNTHTLKESPQYAAQLAGGSVFFQVLSKLDENPVRVVLHDKKTGQRKLLIIERMAERAITVTKPQVSPPRVLSGITDGIHPPFSDEGARQPVSPSLKSPTLKSPGLKPSSPSPFKK